MNVHSFVLPLAYLGATLGVAMVLPQLSRTMRHPSLPGVSALSWGLTAVACLAWLGYGVRTATMPQIPGNILLITGAVAVVLLVPSPWSRSRRALSLGTSAAAILALAVVLPAQTIGYVAFAIGLVSAWPQLVESFANWRSGGESGLSLTTWSVKLASSSCWLAYALLATDLPVAVASAFGMTANIAVFGMEASLRLRGVQRAEPALERA